MTSFWIQVGLSLAGNFVPLILAIFIAWWLKTRKNGEAAKMPRWPIVLGAVVSVPAAVLTLSRAASASVVSPVQVMKEEQSSTGLSNDTFNAAYIAKVGDYILNQIKARVPALGSATAKSSLVETGGVRLGVIRISYDGATPMISVLGVRGPKLVRITCGVPTTIDVNYHDPICEDALKKAFGVELD